MSPSRNDSADVHTAPSTSMQMPSGDRSAAHREEREDALAAAAAPLPPHFDLRRISPIEISDHLQGIAVNIFNQRTVSLADLAADDVTGDFAPLDGADQMTLFVALFYMYGRKVGALKNVTGIG